MNKLFWYTRKEKIKDKDGVETEKVFRDSFNIDCVVRTMEFTDAFIILLNDGHERSEESMIKGKNGKPEIGRKRNWVQSEILIQGEDMQRFIKETIGDTYFLNKQAPSDKKIIEDEKLAKYNEEMREEMGLQL